MTQRAARCGFTLVELLIGMVLSAVVGLAAIQVVQYDARLTENREAWRTARVASRSALTVLSSDIRMVETREGVEAAFDHGKDLTLRVPYAIGALCATNGNQSTVALLPVDSVMFAAPGFSGFAFLAGDPVKYDYVMSGAALAISESGIECLAAGITMLPAAGGSPAGKLVMLTGPVPPTLLPGTVFLLFRRIRYEFKSSLADPGHIGLWRTLVTSGETEELAVPFDTSARFRYYAQSSSIAQDHVPSPLGAMTGLELRLNGRSEGTPRGMSSPVVVRFATAVFFRNRQ